MSRLPRALVDRLSHSVSAIGDLNKAAESSVQYLLQQRYDSGPEAKMDEGVALIVCCYAEAAKIDLSPEELRSQLRDAGLTDGQIEAICNVYKNHKVALRNALLRIGWHPPHVLGVDWKLDYAVKGNAQGTIAKPTFLISFKVQDCNQDAPRDVVFNCSVDQLQDMVWKLKEATRTVQKAANQSQ